MKAQISAGLNFSMAGIPYWTMDIGGFCVEKRYEKGQRVFDKTGNENADLKEWRELNTRWYQFGAFAPLFRAHGQFPYREVYNIAPDNHPAYQSIVYYTKLRYSMMPYIYSLAGMTYFKDYTIMRALVMDFEKDPDNWNYKGDKPAIIDFYATWCGPCKATAPILDSLAEEYKDKIIVYKVDVDKEQELASMFGIRSIPSLLFIPMQGDPKMQVGAMGRMDLENAIKNTLLK
jgi:thioredoxin